MTLYQAYSRTEMLREPATGAADVSDNSCKATRERIDIKLLAERKKNLDQLLNRIKERIRARVAMTCEVRC